LPRSFAVQPIGGLHTFTRKRRDILLSLTGNEASCLPTVR